MCMGEESVYKLLIKTMKEMEKRGYIGFTKTKVLSFPTLKDESFGYLSYDF